MFERPSFEKTVIAPRMYAVKNAHRASLGRFRPCICVTTNRPANPKKNICHMPGVEVSATSVPWKRTKASSVMFHHLLVWMGVKKRLLWSRSRKM